MQSRRRDLWTWATARLARAVAVVLLLAAAPDWLPAAAAAQAGTAPLASRDGGFFTIATPPGWELAVGGHCVTFAVVARDPREPARQVFYFSSVGPLTLSEQQHRIDLAYMRSGGYPIAWAEFPVIEPASPARFFSRWQALAQTSIARQFIRLLPQLDGLKIIGTTALPTPFAPAGGRAEVVRAVFREGGSAAEGLLSATIVQLMPFMNGPGGHIGRAYAVTGVTAPQPGFAGEATMLLQIAASLRISDAYVSRCIQELGRDYEGVARAGQTLRETSEIITRGWQARQQAQDVAAAKYADTIRGVERLHDPDTGQVYEFPLGFHDRYSLRPGAWNKPNLQPLPDRAYPLWQSPALDGAQHVRPN